MVGVDPRPYSLRQLNWMSQGRQAEAWNHTSQLLWAQFRIANPKKTRNLSPLKFHPFAKLIGGIKRKLSREESRARLKAFASSYDRRKSTKSRESGDRTEPADG